MHKHVQKIFAVALVCYLASLFLPAIHYVPSVNMNPKASACGSLTGNFVCSEFPFEDGDRLSCGAPEMYLAETLIDNEKIKSFCLGWDQPMASVDYGYKVLLMGWAGVFVFCFAWFANVSFVTSALLMREKTKLALILSLVGLALSVQSFVFRTKWLDEGFVKSLDVERLGIGFYLWFFSLILITVCAGLQFRASESHEKNN